MKNIITQTELGSITGLEFEEHVEYRGIRYAQAERFCYPKAIDSWSAPVDATEFGACAYQRRSFEDDAVCNAFYHKEFRETLTFTYSEDCLFLNIWSPKGPKNCPVIIYIHGGSFTGGSSNEGHISGVDFARKGVIFVAFNYRLGPFGFCSHPHFADGDKCGNFGLYDQYTAIKWVKDHISDFGGDPEKITLMGQSAGAMSVDIHSSSPLEKNYFSSLVYSSGVGLQRFLARPLKPEKTVGFWENVMTKAGQTDIEALRSVPPKDLYYAWLEAQKDSKISMLYTLPVIDGTLLTKKDFSKTHVAETPALIGVTNNDMLPVVLRFLASKYGKLLSKKQPGACYTYYFDHDLPGDCRKAWHSSDLLYFFCTLQNNWRPYTDADRKLSSEMNDILVSFAQNGVPSCKEIPNWKPSFCKPMHLSTNPVQAKWPTNDLLKRTFKKGIVE